MIYCLFHHIPKTGGTSIKHFMQSSKLNFCENLNGKRNHIKYLPKKELKKRLGLDCDLFTFTFLRDPVEQSRSLYSYVKSHKNHLWHKKTVQLTLEEWIEEFLEDSFCKFLSPKEPTAFAALQNLKSLDFVGFTETLENDMNRMLDILEYGGKYDGRHHLKGKKFPITAKQIKLIKEKRPEDFKLHAEARRLWSGDK
ncbi:MAG: sulfotransferase family 2 domain-containing protein [Candidatus Hodarchaeales archaeon]